MTIILVIHYKYIKGNNILIIAYILLFLKAFLVQFLYMRAKNKKNVVIVGGGFAGIKCALELEKKKLPDVNITLITKKQHFEYYPRIYRAVTGDSPLEVCICLSEIFLNKNIKLVIDEIVDINLEEKNVSSLNKTYKYDDVVLALGNETVYFGIEGLEERAFGFKSIGEALKLKKHLHKMFDIYLSSNKEDLVSRLHIVIVGGGPSGVELAGKLTAYMRSIAAKHAVDNNFVTIDIVESSSRLLPLLPETISKRVQNRLRKLGINIFLNRTVVRSDVDEITMKDMSLKSNTLIWTAGSRTNNFYKKIPGLTFHNKNKIIVDDYLNVFDIDNLYIAGDAAFTKYSGFAQTAIRDGIFIGKNLYRKYKSRRQKKYKPKRVGFAVPVGKGWAALGVGKFFTSGFFAYIIRELIDIQFFLTILPLKRVMRIFFFKRNISELCENCSKFDK